MMIIRFLGVAFAFVITFTIAKLADIPVLDMVAIVAFLLTCDSLVVRFIARQYMLAIANELQDPKEKRRSDDWDKE